MTWLEGTVADAPPTTDDDWRRLVEHLAAIHQITPQTTRIDLSESVLSMRNPEDGIARIRVEVDAIPLADQPAALRALMDRFEAHAFPIWPPPPTALRRGDPNIRNIVQRPGPWASVDWEYSGWSDPALEVADLIAHAAYLNVPAERWEWVTRQYAELVTDPGIDSRIRVYTALMYGFWVGRLGKMLYQVPRGLDDRLAPWPDGWLDHVQRTYERYVELANRALG
jgi:aminoglycoside phosphotransferase (APT) family kinase protein